MQARRFANRNEKSRSTSAGRPFPALVPHIPPYALSNSPAAPIPPPMHMVTNPSFASRRFIS